MLSRLDDGRVAGLLRMFPTKLDFAGFAVLSLALATSAVAGSPPDPLGIAVFAYCASSCLLGGVLVDEGARRGISVSSVGWVENEVSRDGGDLP